MPIFRRFRTKLDTDVEAFLVDKAISYERSGAGRTWLVVSNNNPGVIAGYFTIGLNTLHFKDGINDVEEAYPGIQLYTEDYLPVYSLFLIGKSDDAPKNLSMGRLFVEQGLARIRECKSIIGGSLLYIDCIDQLVGYYKKLGFEEFERHEIDDPKDGRIGLNTMIMPV